MKRHKWKLLLLVVFVAPLLVVAYDRVQVIYWVGSTDLEVEFAITDAATGSPIPGARVEVHSDGGFYEERDKQEFVLVAGTDGIARKECRRSMCCGTKSGLGFTHTFVAYLPSWQFRVVAHGFESGKWTDLDVAEYIREARRVSPGKAKLVVPVSLHKRDAEKVAN